MAIGDANCDQCKSHPSHKTSTCGHNICYEHLLQIDSCSNCGICGGIVQFVTNIRSGTLVTVDELRRIADIKSDSSTDHKLISGRATMPHGSDVPHNNNNSQGNRHSGTPSSRNTHQARTSTNNRGDGGAGASGPRYLTPQMRGEPDIIRPESSMSNISNSTFASQAPINYGHGPAHITQQMSTYNPFNAPRFTQQPYLGPVGMGRPGLPQRTNNSITPMQPQRYVSSGVQASSNVAAPALYNYSTIAQPTPARRDSGAPTSRAAYLADRIKQGHADDPFDPDYGNPGPSKKPAALVDPIPLLKGTSMNANNQLSTVISYKEKNTQGNPVVFLGNDKVPIPNWYQAALAGTSPTLNQVFETLPFLEACRFAGPSTAGVIKVVNIPYATSRSEVNAFLGKNAQICFQPPGTGFHAVHIVMDRHSGKTMDAFVEVSTPSEAVWVVNQFQKRAREKRPGKIGDRAVEVELSNQDELMGTIFSRAKNCTWDGGVPQIDPRVEMYYEGVPSTGFKGFLQDEELVHIVKHAETPQRSPFVMRCMVRNYEYLTTTLYKYPWFAHEHVLITERNQLFTATVSALRGLITSLRKNDNKEGKLDKSMPTANTLLELAIAVFVCPGFSDKQKSIVASNLKQCGFSKLVDDRALGVRLGGVDKFAEHMPFHALVKQPGVADDVVDHYATLLQDATTGFKTLSLADLHAMRASSGKEDQMFGDLLIDYEGATTLADVGRTELRYLEGVLGRILPRAGTATASSASDSRSSSLRLQ